MSAREYQLMIMESAGGAVRRVRIPRLRIVWVAATALGVLLLSIWVGVHSLVLRSSAHSSAQLRAENEVIRSVIADLESGLPDLQDRTRRAQMSFRQVWAKSGLGTGPTLLGVGPLEGRTALGEKTEAGVLGLDPLALGLELDRLNHDAAPLRETLSSLVDYFNDAKQILSSTPSVRPASSTRFTSGFGKRRDPIDGRLMMHKGLDIAGPVGSHIIAPADGVVIFAGTRGGYGRTLVIDHGYGYQTHFAHLNAFVASVGDRVSRGQHVAYMGSTGKSTGPHLHYEVRLFGQPVNPMRFILD